MTGLPKMKKTSNFGDTNVAATLRVRVTWCRQTYMSLEERSGRDVEIAPAERDARRRKKTIMVERFVNEKLVEADDGERRSTWREYDGNVGSCKTDRDKTMWKNRCE